MKYSNDKALTTIYDVIASGAQQDFLNTLATNPTMSTRLNQTTQKNNPSISSHLGFQILKENKNESFIKSL
jgi:hypothetical protein